MNPDKTIKIIFFSTSDRSLPILDAIVKNFNLAFCITKKNSKIGRKQIEKETEVP
jgi:methionyl-tRNA formyltransferase